MELLTWSNAQVTSLHFLTSVDKNAFLSQKVQDSQGEAASRKRLHSTRTWERWTHRSPLGSRPPLLAGKRTCAVGHPSPRRLRTTSRRWTDSCVTGTSHAPLPPPPPPPPLPPPTPPPPPPPLPPRDRLRMRPHRPDGLTPPRLLRTRWHAIRHALRWHYGRQATRGQPAAAGRHPACTDVRTAATGGGHVTTRRLSPTTSFRAGVSAAGVSATVCRRA